MSHTTAVQAATVLIQIEVVGLGAEEVVELTRGQLRVVMVV